MPETYICPACGDPYPDYVPAGELRCSCDLREEEANDEN